MKKNSKLFIFLLLTFVCCNKLVAQKIIVSVPEKVYVGENFRLSYTINSQDVENFHAGTVPSGIEIIAGPYTSQQSSYQMVNGHTSSSSLITFTYTLYAVKQGIYSLPSAQAVVNGRKIKSNAVKVTIVGKGHSRNNIKNQYNEDGEFHDESSRISGNSLFIRVSANKRRVCEQEPITLTYKVYTLVDLTQLKGDMPELTGFHTQEVKLPQQKSFHIERVNGRPYRCVTWSQYVMYPQMTGKLTIPSITFKGIIVQQNRSVDPFEAFFNGGSGYTEVKRDIKAPSLTIQVDPLPNRPSNFSGGVGKFNVSTRLSKSVVKAGQPVTLTIEISGVGNLKLLKQPNVIFPKDFEKYDVKITDKTRLTSKGIEGKMVYEYLVIPQNQGEYSIPAISFNYFDVEKQSYKDIKTQNLSLKVIGGNKRDNGISEFQKDDNDIHDIKVNDKDNHEVGDYFFGSIAYFIIIILLILIFVSAFILLRRYENDKKDAVKLRGVHANKMATKKLKLANKLMERGDTEKFYNEVLHTLWDYVSDKLNMSIEELSRTNISEKLSARGVDYSIIHIFISAIDECEFERYAPGDMAGNMKKTLDSAFAAITKIELFFRNNKK